MLQTGGTFDKCTNGDQNYDSWDIKGHKSSLYSAADESTVIDYN